MHSAILLTFIKLPFVIKIFVLSIFEWLLKTGFTIVSEQNRTEHIFIDIKLRPLTGSVRAVGKELNDKYAY